MRRSIESRILRIVDVGGSVAARSEKKIVLDSMGGRPQVQSFGANGFCEISPEVAMWSHLDRGPIGKSAVVHGEAVVMLEHGHDVFRARVLEQASPRCRVEFLSLELRDEILVTELVLGSVRGDVMLVLVRALVIHVARIPFVAKSRNRIDTPVNEYSELRVHVPLGHFVMPGAIPSQNGMVR